MRWFVLLMLAGCGEGTGEGGDMPAPDTAPMCTPPSVDDCEGHTGPDATGMETCADGRRVRYWSDRISYYSEGRGYTHCWPDGYAALVVTCTGDECQPVETCYGTNREQAPCDEPLLDQMTAAWASFTPNP